MEVTVLFRTASICVKDNGYEVYYSNPSIEGVEKWEVFSSYKDLLKSLSENLAQPS